MKKRLWMIMLAAVFSLLLFIPETAKAADSSQSVKVSASKTKLYTGEFTKLTVKAKGISNPKYEYISGNPRILSVDANGIVQATGTVKKSTKVKVTVKETKTGKKAAKTFTVKPLHYGTTVYSLDEVVNYDTDQDGYTEKVWVDRFSNTRFAVYDSNAFYIHVGDQSFMLYWNSDGLEDWQFGNVTVYGLNTRYFVTEVSIWAEGDLPEKRISVFDCFNETEVTAIVSHGSDLIVGRKGSSETFVTRGDTYYMEYAGIHNVFRDIKFNPSGGFMDFSAGANVAQIGSNLKINCSCTAFKSPGSSSKVFSLNKGDAVHIYKFDFANDCIYVANSKGKFGWITIDRRNMFSGVLNDLYTYYFGE